MKKTIFAIKESLNEFYREDDGVGIVEVMLILAVLIFLVALFKDQVVSAVQSASAQFETDQQNILELD